MGSLSTIYGLCLVTVHLNPIEDAVVDRVDLIEINHFYDEQSRLVFDQIMFYEWSAAESHYQLRDWRLLKSPAQIPLRNWRNRDFVAVWHDFKSKGVLRKVHARMIRETWTHYDPEIVEREFLSQDRRRELRRFIPQSPLANTDGPAARTAEREGAPTNTRR